MAKELEQFYAQKLTKMPSGEREIVRRNQIKDNEASARATTGESWANLSNRQQCSKKYSAYYLMLNSNTEF